MLNHLVFNGKVRNNEQNNSFYPRAGKRFATETLKIWNPLPARIANNSDGPPVRQALKKFCMESHRSNLTSNGAHICSHSDHEAVAVAIAVRRRTENPDYVPSRDEAIRPLVKETVELLSAAAGSMYWRQIFFNVILVVFLAAFLHYGVLNCDGSSSGIWGAFWTLLRYFMYSAFHPICHNVLNIRFRKIACSFLSFMQLLLNNRKSITKHCDRLDENRCSHQRSGVMIPALDQGRNSIGKKIITKIITKKPHIKKLQ